MINTVGEVRYFVPMNAGYPPPAPTRRNMLPAALLSAAFVIAAVLLAVHAHSADKPGAFAPVPVGSGEQQINGSGGQQINGGGGGQQINGGAQTTAPASTPTVPAQTTTSASAPVLDPAKIDRVFADYMDALVEHDLAALKRATCPRLRGTEVGVALHGRYVSRWRENPYDVGPYLNYTTVTAKLSLQDPASGAAAGTVTYAWYVERDTDGAYWVCGFLS